MWFCNWLSRILGGENKTFKDYCIIHKMTNVAASPMESFLQMAALNR